MCVCAVCAVCLCAQVLLISVCSTCVGGAPGQSLAVLPAIDCTNVARREHCDQVFVSFRLFSPALRLAANSAAVACVAHVAKKDIPL